MAVEVYDPPPSREYVRLIEAELLKMREELPQALEDCNYADKEVMKWHLIHFYKKIIGWKPRRTLTPLSSLVFPTHLMMSF